MSLPTSLPLSSASCYGRACSSVKVEEDLSYASSVLFLHNSGSDKCTETLSVSVHTCKASTNASASNRFTRWNLWSKRKTMGTFPFLALALRVWTGLKYRGYVLSFLAKSWRQRTWRRAIQFVILCGNRWLNPRRRGIARDISWRLTPSTTHCTAEKRVSAASVGEHVSLRIKAPEPYRIGRCWRGCPRDRRQCERRFSRPGKFKNMVSLSLFSPQTCNRCFYTNLLPHPTHPNLIPVMPSLWIPPPPPTHTHLTPDPLARNRNASFLSSMCAFFVHDSFFHFQYLWRKIHRSSVRSSEYLKWFTLSLPRVINVKVLQTVTRNTTSHSMKNLAFHSLIIWRMIDTTWLIHFSLKGRESVLFELGSERVKIHEKRSSLVLPSRQAPWMTVK